MTSQQSQSNSQQDAMGDLHFSIDPGAFFGPTSTTTPEDEPTGEVIKGDSEGGGSVSAAKKTSKAGAGAKKKKNA